MLNTIADANTRYLQTMSHIFSTHKIAANPVGNAVRGARQITYYLNLHDPTQIDKLTSLTEPLALGCMSESVFMYRHTGVVVLQVTLPFDLRIKVERGENINGMDIGMINRKNLVAHTFDAPHTLVAGTTGAGKSILVSNILLGLMKTYSPQDLRIVMIDPNTDFDDFENTPHIINFPWGYRSSTIEEHMSALNWVNKLFEYRRANSIKDDYSLVFLIDEGEQVGKQDSTFWLKLDTLAAQARKYKIFIIITSKRPMVKEIPIINLLTNRYIGRLDVDKSTAKRLINKVDNFSPNKLALKGDFITENDVRFNRFQVANIDKHIFKELDRGTIFNENAVSSEEFLSPKQGRPQIVVSPSILATLGARGFRSSERDAAKLGITQTEWKLHMAFAEQYYTKMRTEKRRINDARKRSN